ncbi:hypothetical protein GX50_05436 [[Emmonsia] crescens]|uniref:Uncharacterized protein n=1 Tax=[Emmonsia] crescens TaxID=73230 RepID=A0A2B7ZEI6_9EURO|nr:hypothetical protein GX50_05436 [Emmonsia crescens]
MPDNEPQLGAESQGNEPGDGRRWLLELETPIDAKLKADVGHYQIYVYFWEGDLLTGPGHAELK